MLKFLFVKNHRNGGINLAKKVIKISKGGSPSSVTQNIVPPRGPRPPARLNAAPPPPAPAPEPTPQKRIITAASKARPAVTEPQKRIITAASRNRTATPAAATPPAKQNASGQPQPPKKKAGPPLWLIPVGIIGLITIIVIIVSVSSNSRRDPYFDTDTSAQYKERKPYVDPNANRPRPMKEFMEQHGPSDMAKERMERMKKRPTTTATEASN